MVKHMRYREFVDWCNQRAANGEWGMSEAIKCIATIGIIRKEPFWRREAVWQNYYAPGIIFNIVQPINEMLKEKGK